MTISGDLRKMTPPQLKQILLSRGVHCTGCSERKHFEDKILETNHLPSRPPPEHSGRARSGKKDFKKHSKQDKEEEESIRELLERWKKNQQQEPTWKEGQVPTQEELTRHFAKKKRDEDELMKKLRKKGFFEQFKKHEPRGVPPQEEEHVEEIEL
eukprot:TRINITY_DN33_c0_g1_i7.p1 TRINITY_DN33_c0_g1~~TRINITY_DN33_c0_g1_i7.p1  ORF type:complete len:155 (-),score=56.15 TRINITY_DN33_c0_g1_i7:144-608(-)